MNVSVPRSTEAAPASLEPIVTVTSFTGSNISATVNWPVAVSPRLNMVCETNSACVSSSFTVRPTVTSAAAPPSVNVTFSSAVSSSPSAVIVTICGMFQFVPLNTKAVALSEPAPASLDANVTVAVPTGLNAS